MISIIVPVYKAEKYISRCVDSIIAQSYTEWELLLIDDGSPDNSGNICDAYATKDTRIKVFHKENGGVSSARNMGLNNTCGDFVAFADADDIYLPKAFENLVEIVLKYDDVDLVLGNAIIQYNTKKIKMRFAHNEIICKNAEHLPSHIEIWGNLFRKSIIINNNIRFNENLSYAEDRVFVYEYFLHSHKLVELPFYVYKYIIGSDSAMTQKNGFKKASSSFAAAKLIQNLCSDSNSIELNNELMIASKKAIKRGIKYMVSQKDRDIKEFKEEYLKYFSNSIYFNITYVKAAFIHSLYIILKKIL